MSRAITQQRFGGTEALVETERDVPRPGAGEIRIRVVTAGLNPVDWQIVASPALAEAFGISLPAGFGNDFAGVVDDKDPAVTAWQIGDRIFGGARGSAAADHVIVSASDPRVHRTPDGVDDLTAGTIDIAGRTASAVADHLALGATDTVLIGAAGGGVGTILTQLARLAGARVIGTGSATSFDYLRSIGAEPVEYGSGLVDRLRELAPGGLTAAADLFDTSTATVALTLGVAADRIVTIEAEEPPHGVHSVNGSDARPGALLELLRLVERGELRVPIAATFPLERFREAVDLQRARHVQGKIALVLG